MAEVATKSRKANSNRGSKPGERRGGRQKGTPNKSTSELRELARSYTDQAIKALVDIMLTGSSEQARITAAGTILDRGYGKPSQPVDGDGEGGAIQLAHKIALIGVEPDAD